MSTDDTKAINKKLDQLLEAMYVGDLIGAEEMGVYTSIGKTDVIRLANAGLLKRVQIGTRRVRYSKKEWNKIVASEDLMAKVNKVLGSPATISLKHNIINK